MEEREKLLERLRTGTELDFERALGEAIVFYAQNHEEWLTVYAFGVYQCRNGESRWRAELEKLWFEKLRERASAFVEQSMQDRALPDPERNLNDAEILSTILLWLYEHSSSFIFFAHGEVLSLLQGLVAYGQRNHAHLLSDEMTDDAHAAVVQISLNYLTAFSRVSAGCSREQRKYLDDVACSVGAYAERAVQQIADDRLRGTFAKKFVGIVR